jgi:hypothetical protein
MAAFTVSSIFATAIFFGGGWAVAVILIIAVLLVVHTHRLHKEREQVESAAEIFNLRKISDAEAATRVTFEHAGLFLSEVRTVIDENFNGLIKEDRHVLRQARLDQRRIQHWSNVIAANVFKVFRLLQWQEVEHTQRYAQAIASLQEISESVRDMVVRAKQHVDNNHSGLLQHQIDELHQVQGMLDQILDRSAAALQDKACPDCDAIEAQFADLRKLVNTYDQHQIQRIQDNASKTRLSILFYSLVWDSVKIGEQTLHLLEVLKEWLTIGNGTPPDEETA